MTQRRSWSSSFLVLLGLIVTGASVALPKLFTSSVPAPLVWKPAQPVTASTTWFGQASAEVGASATFWLGDEDVAYVPLSSWRYTELSNGTARTSCLFGEAGDTNKRWWFEASLSARTGVSEPSEPGRWHRLAGTLRGLGELDGALLQVRNERGSVIQIADGEASPSFEGRFQYEVVTAAEKSAEGTDSPESIGFAEGSGRGGFSAGLYLDDASHVSEPVGGGVLTLPGIGAELVFVAGGRMEEHADGSARLSGVVARDGDREVTFALDLDLSASITPGEDAYPPEGSPSHEFTSDNYTQYGGSIDDRTWRYYRSAQGTLTGLGVATGALVELESEGPVFQVGVGANGVTRGFGAAGHLSATTLRQPSSEVRLSETTSGALRVELGRGYAQFAAAVEPSSAGRRGADFNLDLAGLGHDFVFTSGGRFSEQPDGGAHLSGTVARRSAPETQLFVQLAFNDHRASAGAEGELGFEPRKTLLSRNYAENGGVVDPRGWHAYGEVRGSLYGLGELAGARFDVSGKGSNLQVGVGANGRNLAYGGSGEFLATMTATPHGDVDCDERIEGVVGFSLATESRESVFAAKQQPALEGVQRHGALRIAELGSDFVFVSGGEFVQRADGHASLTGVVARRSYPMQRFFLAAELNDCRLPSAAGHPPHGSPKLSLPAEHLAQHGGVVDPASWTYYERLEGQLYGLDDFAGARISFEREGPAFQIGLGANNRNVGYGAAAWFSFDVERAPTRNADFPQELGLGELTLEPRREYSRRAEEAIAITAVELPAGHALSLPGLAVDLVFPHGGEFREFANGTASLTGKVARAGDSSQSFDVLLDFKDRVDPGFGNFPPQGSPTLELPSAAYTSHGGVVDPERWHYFQSVEGILVGTGEWAGSLLEVRELGSATQVGHGANGRNFAQGASVVLDIKVIQAPADSISWPSGHLQGRLDIDLENAELSSPSVPGAGM